MNSYLEILKHYWGYDSFRPLQLDIIESIGSGKDTLGLMPTGGGKSLTFQVPAMTMEGVCLVVTPLIALMKDQVQELKRRGIGAAMIYSGMQRHEILQTLENCEFGAYKFLYLSPERLGTELFKKRVVWLKIAMIAIDEAHCISQWGYDFRPSYLKIAEIRELLPNVPVLALTATATPEVTEDIQNHLGFPKHNLFRKSFYRENLAYVVRETDDKDGQLLRILSRVPGSAVVYVRNRLKCQEINDLLRQNKIGSNYYHAGLPDKVKNERQEAWKRGDCRVIVATNAFGMGIDKPDVRVVVHMDIPDNIEAYFQEAGRAGRDGNHAYAIMLYNNSDLSKLKKRISDNFPEKELIRKVYQSLAEHYTIGLGDGQGSVHPFEIDEFCVNWHMPVLQTFSALKIMEISEILELTEAHESPSKLRFIVEREELYALKGVNRFQEQLIEHLLRNYTGIMTDMVHINEDRAAEQLRCERQQVYNALIALQANHIVKYIPFKKVPLIIYKTPRQLSEKLYITRASYEERLERFKMRIAAISDYAQENQICRSRQLLHYFGEDKSDDCGICDVCLSKRKNPTTRKEQRSLRDIIIALIEEAPRNIRDITEVVSFPSNEISETVRLLLDNGIIYYNDQEMLDKKR